MCGIEEVKEVKCLINSTNIYWVLFYAGHSVQSLDYSRLAKNIKYSTEYFIRIIKISSPQIRLYSRMSLYFESNDWYVNYFS